MQGFDSRATCVALRIVLSEIDLTRRAYEARVLGQDGTADILSARAAELRERICRLREASHDYPARPVPAPAPSAN